MEQFEIHRIISLNVFGHDVSFTNSSLMMIIALFLVTAFMVFAMRSRSLIPSRVQSLAEITYEYVAGIVKESLGEEGMKYFPWIFSIFIFILFLNFMSLLPGSFAVTSHIIVTFALAAMVWITATVIGFWKHGAGYLRLFVPHGVPLWLLVVIVPIELISYFIRPISHSVRLFANMMAGHTMLEVFAGFAVMLPWWGKIAPAGFMVAFTGLELLVAFLQALIFTVLTCIYLNDAINMHH
ncbi:F0F1 ATP synthase subunit A [Hyphomicrobium sp. GJ21]|jgi:F-type H+-transporting ATPase subunit a|uniref:F0F1 ATP synthase subunit A n=1 Tax=Hyphomicrobium sp. GJ21 TaxID=113574 RepID=UPI0019035112|nr:F0F1 ATP synthase subunit A [Hyphomicrobium sp. GJ21]MBN9352483.1 F0F1 ATP synthase subunit A [Hyphomicrobium denitrificans]